MFWRTVLPNQSLGVVLKNEIKQQKHTCIRNKIYYNIKINTKMRYVIALFDTSALDPPVCYRTVCSGPLAVAQGYCDLWL